MRPYFLLLSLLMCPSLRALELSMIEDINLRMGPIPESTVLKKIASIAKRKKTYLSIGESHLYPDSTRIYAEKLQKQFFDNVKTNVRTCHETISSLDEYPYYDYFNLHSAEVIASTSNSPKLSNFKQCYSDEYSLNFYSGFFHQYPLSIAFKNDFPVTEVSGYRGNNIYDQMSGLKGVFVSFIDLDYLEKVWTQSFFKKKFKSVRLFREKANLMISKVDTIMKGLQWTHRTHNLWRDQWAFIIDKSFFPFNKKVRKTIPDNAFIYLTEQAFRVPMKKLKLIRALNQLSDERIENFLELLKDMEKYFISTEIQPMSNGDRSHFNIGSLPVSFGPESEIFYLLNKKKNIKKIIFVQNDNLNLECLDPLNSTNVEIDCSDLF
ncbi:MAG: hypothetical protein H6621_09170 [Halobacteriovoraceae bacterium]|nr:hypothetical protein [Halobacteriovoraceae bacterium]MCB9095225.1 hypothetical protein [Halobacteriovoraceae bacterium]